MDFAADGRSGWCAAGRGEVVAGVHGCPRSAATAEVVLVCPGFAGDGEDDGAGVGAGVFAGELFNAFDVGARFGVGGYPVVLLYGAGSGDLVKSAVVVVSHHGPRIDDSIRSWLDESFAHRVGSVVHVPYDPAVADGDRVNYHSLSHVSREAWLAAAARVAQSL